MRKNYEPISQYHTLWREVGERWTCVSRDEGLCLADFLASYGFDIPDYITYCLAENDAYSLKFRQSGGLISVFIIPINYV